MCGSVGSTDEKQESAQPLGLAVLVGNGDGFYKAVLGVRTKCGACWAHVPIVMHTFLIGFCGCTGAIWCLVNKLCLGEFTDKELEPALLGREGFQLS